MAKQETDKILYSIGETTGRIEIKTKEGSTTKFNYSNYKNHSSKYDLVNWATLMLDGSIKEASHEFYDTKFKEALNKFKSNGEAKLFLDHHFENTHDKRALLNRIETHIIRRYNTNQNDILLNENKIELVAEWIREKKKELPKEKKEKAVAPKTGMRKSTIEKYKKIVALYNKHKGKLGHEKAIKKVHEEFGDSHKTIYRAIEAI
jgi:hypothetical protein